MHQPLGFCIGNRYGLALAAKETGNARLAGHQLPRFVGQFHFHQDISGEKLALALNTGTTAHFNHLFGGHHNVLDLMRQLVALRLLGD